MLSILCFAQKKDTLLANKIFIVEVTEKNLDGTESPQGKDEIRFKVGKVSSKFSTRNGFPAATYTLTIDTLQSPTVITFTAGSTNGERHTLKWEATISGNSIEGKAARTRTKRPGSDYVFSGMLKQ